MEPRTLFFLASDLGPGGAARQLGLLAAGLPRDRFRVEVGVLGPARSPGADALRSVGVPVHALPLRSMIDVRGMRALREVVAAAKPAVVHAWGPAAVRVSSLLAGPKLVASGSAFPDGGVSGWLTTRQLRHADRVVPATWADAERYRRLGVPADRLTLVAPGVAPSAPPPDRAAFLQELGLPSHARLVITAGRLEPTAVMKAAMWSFDMVRYEFPDLHLLVFGDGPDRDGLEAFGRALAFDDYRVRFPGCRPDLPSLLGLAEAVWVIRDRGGVNLALEAMAAGRPVVGWRTPELAAVVGDDETGGGCLTDPGERPQVSARTHALLGDPTRAAKLGAAGRARAADRFTVGRMVEQYARLYGEL